VRWLRLPPLREADLFPLAGLVLQAFVLVPALIAARIADQAVPQEPQPEADQKEGDQTLLLDPRFHDACFGWHCAKLWRARAGKGSGNCASVVYHSKLEFCVRTKLASERRGQMTGE